MNFNSNMNEVFAGLMKDFNIDNKVNIIKSLTSGSFCSNTGTLEVLLVPIYYIYCLDKSFLFFLFSFFLSSLSSRLCRPLL